MKIFAALALFLSLLSVVSAQKNIIGLKVGFVPPVGIYKSTRLDGGFATVGVGSQLCYTHYFDKVYMGAEAGAFVNGFNSAALDNELEKNVDSAATTGNFYTGLGASVVAGYEFYSADKTHFGGHIKVGYYRFGLPAIESSFINNGISSLVEQSYGRAFGLAGAIGLNIRGQLSKRISILINGEYYIAQPVFRDVSVAAYQNNKLLSVEYVNVKSKMRNFMLYVGFGYNF